MAKDISDVIKRLDTSAVGKYHNEILARLLERQTKSAMTDKIVTEAFVYLEEADLTSAAVREAFEISLRTLVATGALSRPLHELGLSRNLTACLQGYALAARPQRLKSRLSKPVRRPPRLSPFEVLVRDVFGGVFDASLDFWADRFDGELPDDPQPTSLVIPTGSHTGIDVGKLATADASGAVGALAGAGLLGLMGVTTVSGPLSPAGVAGYLATAGAIASFLFYLGGGADVIFEREPLVPAPSPDPGGGDRPVS